MYINLNEFILFCGIAEDPAVQAGVTAYNILEKGADDLKERVGARNAFLRCQKLVLQDGDPVITRGNLWQNHILELLAGSESKFALKCEKNTGKTGLEIIAANELLIIRQLMAIDWTKIAKELHCEMSCACSINASECTGNSPTGSGRRRDALMQALDITDPDRRLSAVADYFSTNFSGKFEAHNAFIWDGQLKGVDNYDGIEFDDLIGYDIQKEKLIANTEIFMAGRPFNNVLLHGDKGTGKSSCIKAMLNMFSGQGMRLINLPKNRIFDLSAVMELVKDRAVKCVVFIDDLSFENTETEYKHFKSVLEGGIYAQPDNVMICVTSNRRNLVKETWSDREGDNCEVHVTDGIQERQSLADRFGLTLTFSAPDKFEYLQIVRTLAARAGINMDPRELDRQAITWDMRHSGRSGRSAKQFVKYLSGQQLQ